MPDGKSLLAFTSDQLQLLDAGTLQDLRTLKATSEPYTAVAVSQNGNRVAVAQGSTIVLWNPGNGEMLRTLRADKKVLALSFSPDGKLLASGGYDAGVTLWDPDKAGKILTLKGHTGWVRGLSFHPDGKLLASGSDDGKIILWDMESKKPVGVLEQYPSEIHKILFSPQGRFLASLDKNRTVVLWDPISQKQVVTLTGAVLQQAQDIAPTPTPMGCEGAQPCVPPLGTRLGYDSAISPSAKILSAAFSPDDRTLALGSADKSLVFWSIPEGRVVRTLPGKEDLPQVMVYSPDGRRLGVAGGTITLWDIEKGEVLQSFRQHTGAVQSLSFNANGQILAAGSLDKKITLWNLVDKKPIKVLEGQNGGTTSLAFSRGDPMGKDSPSGRSYLASGDAGPDHSILLWDLESGRLVKSFKGPARRVRNLVFRHDGRQLALVSENVLLWDVQTGEIFSVVNSSLPENAPLAFSPDGRLLALATGDNRILLWDTETKRAARTLSGHKNPVQAFLFSPDGRRLVSSDNSEFILWDLQNGNAVVTFAEPELPSRLLVFSPDGKLLVSPTGPQRNLIALRSVETGQVLKTLQGHDTSMTDLLFSSTGLLASTSYNKIILWKGTTGQVLKTFEASRPFDFLAFSPEGKILASGAYDKVILWDVDRGDVLASLEGAGFSSNSIRFSPDGRFLAAILQDRVAFWESRRGNLLKTLETPNIPVSSLLAFAPDGQDLAAIGRLEYQNFASWDVGSGKTRMLLNGTDHKITSMAFDPAHQILATGSEEGLVLLWDVKTTKIVKALAGPAGDILSLAFSTDNRVLAARSSNSVLFWEVEEASLIRMLQAFPLYAFFFNPTHGSSRVELTAIGSVQYMDFSPDLKTLALINRDSSVTLLDAESGRVLKNLEKAGYSSTSPASVIFSPDGRLFALRDQLGKVTLWDVESGKVLRTLFSTGKILFSPDGRLLVSEGVDEGHTITLWDVARGQVLKTLPESGYNVASLAFSPDSKLLAVGGEAGGITVYNVP